MEFDDVMLNKEQKDHILRFVKLLFNMYFSIQQNTQFNKTMKAGVAQGEDHFQILKMQ
jgi:hypothetical protein